MKSKLQKIEGESHQQYMKRIAAREKQRIAEKYASRRATVEKFEKIRRGEAIYKPITRSLPSKNAKWQGRVVQLKPKKVEMK